MTGTAAGDAHTEEQESQFSRGRVLVIFFGLILGILMAALDQTIVAAALPTIAGELNGLKLISWIITAYLLAQTISMPLYGKVGDFIGRKRAFQLAIVIFLAGSVLSGIAQSMGMLIAFRTVQGIGAGGLMIGAQSIMAEVVSARHRGRYMSVMMPMIGVATVLGPLLGGYLTQHATWRWIFYINIPIGIAAFAVTSIVLKLPRREVKPRIDLAGAAFLAGAVACLVLLLNWGGSRYGWTSLTVIGLGLGVLVLIPLWIAAERRAPEPVLPLHLFRDEVFRVNVPLAFVTGIAMFGAVSYLPTFLQLAQGVSATSSGLLMLPLMGGLMVAAITTGQLISRTGRYKIFPLMGTALAGVGMYLLSFMDADTSRLHSSLFMAVLGLGIGFVMPTLVLTVQNSVRREDMGSATAGVNFFRQIGASLGVALIGSLFTSRLTDQLARNLPAQAAAKASEQATGITPDALNKLPPQIAEGIIQSYAHALTPLYAYLAPLLGVAFLVVLFLREKPLATDVAGVDAADEKSGHADASSAGEAEDRADAVADSASPAARR